MTTQASTTGIPSSSLSSAAAEPPAAAGARMALILLLLINLFNYIDRQVLAAVEPQIRADFFTDPAASVGVVGNVLGLLGQSPLAAAAAVFPDCETKPDSTPKFWMGMLSTAFLVTYMLAAPIFGWLSNRTSRWMLVGIGVILWSIASGASGLASFYLAMLITRFFVGIGEAVYGPVAPDIISDLFPAKKRGQVLAWFYAAIPFGGALGYTLGAEVVRNTGHWQNAFYSVVPPGILLGIWCFFLREPKRGQSEPLVPADNISPIVQTARKESWRDYLVLLEIPSYVLNTLGMTAMCFAMGGLAFWVPGYLSYRQVYDFLGTPIDARTAFGGITALTGLLATLLGGMVGDRLRPRFPGSYFLVSGTAMLLGFPLLLLMTTLPFPWAWIPLSLFVFCLFFNTGPTNTILANVTHPKMRAPGFAINILVIHLFGDAISPPIMGFIADKTNLDVAFRVVSFTVLAGGLLWVWGSRYLERDTALAPTRLPPG